MNGIDAFVAVAATGDFDKTKAFLESQPEIVNACDENGSTALATACLLGQTRVALLLLENGGEAQLMKSNEAFLNACESGVAALVETLLRFGADVDGFERTGPGLVIASRLGHEAVVKCLLKNNAQVDHRCKKSTHIVEYGPTALIEACTSGHLKIVELLIRHQADLDVQANNGDTALERAITGHFPEIERLLVNSGAKPGTRLNNKLKMDEYKNLANNIQQGPSKHSHGSVCK